MWWVFLWVCGVHGAVLSVLVGVRGAGGCGGWVFLGVRGAGGCVACAPVSSIIPGTVCFMSCSITSLLFRSRPRRVECVDGRVTLIAKGRGEVR